MYTSAGIPGTGLRFVKYYRHHQRAASARRSLRNRVSASMFNPAGDRFWLRQPVDAMERARLASVYLNLQGRSGFDGDLAAF